MRRDFGSDVPWDPSEDLHLPPPETPMVSPTGRGRRIVLFAVGLALGAGLFLIGGMSSQPSPPCHDCVVSNSGVRSPDCVQAALGDWICEAH
jgi:hypothetical protein